MREKEWLRDENNTLKAALEVMRWPCLGTCLWVTGHAILRVKEILEESFFRCFFFKKKKKNTIDEMLTEMAKGARKEAVWSRYASAKRRGLF